MDFFYSNLISIRVLLYLARKQKNVEKRIEYDFLQNGDAIIKIITFEPYEMETIPVLQTMNDYR